MADEKDEKETVGSDARLRKIVKMIYTNGSDNRSQKNGSPETLITKVLQVEHVATCGMFKFLGTELRDYINSKERRKRGEIKCVKALAELILKYEKENNPNVYIKISEKGRAVIDEIIKTGEFSGKKMVNVFKVETIFQFQ